MDTGAPTSGSAQATTMSMPTIWQPGQDLVQLNSSACLTPIWDRHAFSQKEFLVTQKSA